MGRQGINQCQIQSYSSDKYTNNIILLKYTNNPTVDKKYYSLET